MKISHVKLNYGGSEFHFSLNLHPSILNALAMLYDMGNLNFDAIQSNGTHCFYQILEKPLIIYVKFVCERVKIWRNVGISS